ncbi:MAG: glycosyltransferase [Anaerovoracaceae bacterium]|nr:glycosyltransferase [Anaerovoracaceae bacterium]
MKLSIIIPYYDAKAYTDELLDRLAPQLTPEVEVILVDDASPEPYTTEHPVKVIRHKKNKRCAGARNTGLTKASGEYIQFIDADDLVPDYFVSRLLREIDGHPFDVCDFSWRSLSAEGTQHDHRLQSRDDRLTNPSVCTRCFSRAYIGRSRFNINKDSTEDEDFSRKLGYLDPARPCVHTAIPEYMYYYRTAVTGSKIKRFKAGLMKTKRIVYYYPKVTADQTDLLKEIKAEDKYNEVWLLTEQCELPGLSRYCQISKPMQIWAHEARGISYPDIEIIRPPIRTQVVMYCEHSNVVGGIGTFIYNFCHYMRDYYDIVVVYARMDPSLISRLRRIVQVEKERPELTVICDTIILNRLTDRIPKGIQYRKSVQMCHACYQLNLRIPQDRDVLVNVSSAARDSWGEEAAHGVVIHNFALKSSREVIVLVSATRIASDKGQIAERMKTFARKLEREGIPFLWLCFSDKRLPDMPQGFINMGIVQDIQPYLRRADYLVQLSDTEAYSYAVLEALINEVAVICTPFESAWEQGVIDGETGYIVPYDMDFDVSRILNVPKFTYSKDESVNVKQWRKILGDTKPRGDYRPPQLLKVRVLKNYRDLALDRSLAAGDIEEMTPDRVEILKGKGLVEEA